MSKQIEIALGEYSVTGIAGPQNNPRILKYFTDIGASYVHDDETAWCSAFANWVMLQAGLPHTGKLNARSWLDIGIPVQKAALGDIVVLWRIDPKGPYGHVGFFIKEDGDSIWMLGGNQDNSVCIKKQPKYQLLGYRHIS